MKKVKVKDFYIGSKEPLALMAGPCVIESEDLCLRLAADLKKVCIDRGVNFIFKSSFDKANRSSVHSFRGPGLVEGLRILNKIKKEIDVPIITDIHTEEQATIAGEVCDILQIPAFLCRQTDILLAAGRTGKVVSIKKGQFMAPWDMVNAVEKIRSTGNDQIILVDRGVTFGYNNLVSDMRAIPIMQKNGVPVCFDATHSVQLPGGQGETSGGQREFIEILALAAVAAGANCLFVEVHPNPSEALSDASSQLPFRDVDRILKRLQKVYVAVNE